MSTSFEAMVEFVREHDRLKGVAWDYKRLCISLWNANYTDTTGDWMGPSSGGHIEPVWYMPSELAEKITDVALDR